MRFAISVLYQRRLSPDRLEPSDQMRHGLSCAGADLAGYGEEIAMNIEDHLNEAEFKAWDSLAMEKPCASRKE